MQALTRVYARLLSRDTSVVAPGQAPRQIFADATSTLDMVARDRRVNPAVNVQRVSKKSAPGGKTAKSKQAWKYAGFTILRADATTINGRYYTDPKEDNCGDIDKQGTELGPHAVAEGTPRRKQESNFFITVNPNRMFREDTEALARLRFSAALTHLAEKEVLVRYLLFGPKSKHYANDFAHDVIVPSIDWKSTVEVGDEKKRMHAHIILEIEHYSQIQINLKMFQAEFNKAFNSGLADDSPLRLSDPPYLQVKLLPQNDWATIMKQYIRKGMDAANV